MASSSVDFTTLDFDTLKSSLKTYLKTQSNFTDFDFEGSNINVLLDILAYNTYLNSFYTNMAISESFLDSARLRNSVVSHAKELNYLPSSAKSPEALLNLTFNTQGIQGVFEIPKGTQFTGTNANGTFVFTTDTTITSQSPSSTFSFSNVAIYEGSYFNEAYVVNYADENQKFLITNSAVDTDSLTVTVIENNGNVITAFKRADNLYDLTSDSSVYFLQATQGTSYEVLFGDNVFGRIPLNGATVLLNYRATRGTAGGGITSFYLDRDLGQFNGGLVSSSTITTVTPASNGSDPETIEEIRFRAPRAFQTLGRAVTTNDYRNLILDNFPEVKDVNVYGGETVTGSVQYGKVFISPTTYSGSVLTMQRKNDLTTFLSNKKMVTVQNIIIDPEYLYVVPTVSATVNFADTALSPAQLISNITNSITSFNSLNLQAFNTAFRYSKFIEAIDNTDASILSNQTTTQIYKIIQPTLDSATSFSAKFNNSLQPGTIASSSFLTSDGNTYQLTDYNPNINSFARDINSNTYSVVNSNPVIYLKLISTNNSQSYTVVGSVDYDNGIVSIKNLNVVDFLGNAGIQLFATTAGDDIYAKFNDVIEIDLASTAINVVAAQ